MITKTVDRIQIGDLFAEDFTIAEFDEVAFTLPINQISDPVETTYGFHIIEVLNRQDARHVTFEEVQEEVEEIMMEEVLYNLMNEQVDLLWESADIEY